MQKLEEMYAAIVYLMLDPPRKVLEVGSAAGGSFLAWCAVAVSQAVLVSVDIAQHEENQELMRSYAGPRQTTYFIRGDSHDPETARLVREYDTGFDFLFIDADHSEASVRADWADYSPFVRPGGLVGFHDISDGGHIGHLWGELTREHASVKFAQNENDGWGGIGVLRV
jgi:predicted O-methyltransferase YrrM